MSGYTPKEFVTYDGVRFGRATEAYNETLKHPFTGEEITHQYAGMPLFDGNPEHFDAYIALLLKELGDEGIIAMAANEKILGHYNGKSYEVPANSFFAHDVGINGETQWPVGMGFGQTWNKELLRRAGEAAGAEIRGLHPADTVNGMRDTTAHTAVTDIRYNPLIGRFDEGFGEDAHLISEMASAWTKGMADRKDEDSLYYRVIPQTKHWSSYHGEFFRGQNSSNVSVRSAYEQSMKTAGKLYADGTFLGFMSSYGCINGVPATASFMQKYAQKQGNNGLMSLCDAGSEMGYVMNTSKDAGFSNGYDHCYSSDYSGRAASMMLAGHTPGRASMPGIKVDLVAKIKLAIEHGIQGLTMENVTAVARPFLEAAVRSGAMDERDENGMPKYYPFVSSAKNCPEKVDHTDPEHQKIALETAREAIVLTKNNGALPLKKGKTAVFGRMADAVQFGLYSSHMRDKDSYSAAAPAGISLVEGICAKLGADNVVYETGEKVFQIMSGKKFLTVHQDNSLTFEDTPNDASRFELADWGQGVVSVRSCKTGKWLKTGARNTMFDPPEDAEDNAFIPGPSALMGGGRHPNCNQDLTVYADGEADFRPDYNTGFLPSFGFPEFLERKATEGGFALKCGNKFTTVDFGTRSATPDLMGWYLKAGENNLMVDADPHSSRSTAVEVEQSGMTGGHRFTENILAVPGAAAASTVEETESAVIVLGMPYNGICGEGTDRITLKMADEQVAMAHQVAAIYAAAGKPSVVVVKMDAPAAVQELQDDPNIDAIITMPMCGQYEAVALADIIFGDAAPSGRLNATWYASDEELPQITKYSLPYEAKVVLPGDKEGRIVGLEDVSTRTDFTNVDLQQCRLTYQYYTGKETYPFGYGLSYTTFVWSNLRVQEKVQAGEAFSVSVDVTNTGAVDSAEVVQVYLCPKASAYGEFAPKKMLGAFEKVFLKAKETKTVSLTVRPETISIWDVNAHCYRVEPGMYTLYAAKDASLNEALSAEITVEGAPVSNCAVDKPINLWKHSYGAKDMVYREFQKNQTAKALRGTAEQWDETFAVMSVAEGAWIVLKAVPMSGIVQALLTAGTENESGSIEIHADAPDGTLLGVVDIPHTGEVCVPRYTMDKEYDAGTIHELGYTDITVPVNPIDGVHDLYLVFRNADIRAFAIILQ